MRNGRSSTSRARFGAIPPALLCAAGVVLGTSVVAQEKPPDLGIAEAQSSIEVRTLDEKTREPIPFVSFLLVQSGKSFIGTQAGTLELDLPIGTQRLRVSHVSYEPIELDITPIQGVKTSRTILMKPRLLVFPVLEVSAPSPAPKPANIGVQTLRTESLSSLPNLRDDPFQMLRVLPGVTTDDVGADFHMRGGGQHETLVRIDGMEVRQLFHGRDFGGITSIIPFGVVEKMDVYSGAFPAQYGGKLSGVVDIGLRSDEREGVEDPWTKDSGIHVKAGLDVVSARVLAEGHNEKASGFVSVREGYLDRVLDVVQDEAVIQPAYRDMLLRAVHHPTTTQSVSLNYLRSEDHIFFEDRYPQHYVNADYIDHFFWSTWRNTSQRRLSVTATGFGAISQQLRNVGQEGRDDQNLHRFGGRFDLGVRASDEHLFKFGGQAEQESGTSFARSEEVVSIGEDGTAQTSSEFEGVDKIYRLRSAVYLLDDWHPNSALVINGGVRFSHDNESGESRWNPRASASLQLGHGWTATSAWGIYDQPPEGRLLAGPNLRLESDRAAWAEHIVCGIQKRLSIATIGADAYTKKFRQLDGVLERTLHGEVEQEIITRGGSSGIEVFVQRASHSANWWFTYTLARSEWGNAQQMFLRNFDQLHAFSLANTIRFAKDWDVGATYAYHSGQPFTLQNWNREQAGTWVLTEGPLNGARLPDYHRLDVRLRRHFRFDDWRMSVYAEGLNLTNHDNVLWYSWALEPGAGGGVHPVRSVRTGMPMLPSLGIEVEF
jgi:outer membrane cobalamin receptor